MCNNYDVSIRSTPQDLQFSLERTDTLPDVMLNGFGYSLQTDQAKDFKAMQLFLQQIQLPSNATENDLKIALKNLPSILDVNITTKSKKIKEIGVSFLVTNAISDADMQEKVNLKKASVENGLLPPIPSPGKPVACRNIEQRMVDLGVPGVSIAVINNNEIEWSQGYGQLEQDYLIQAASTSKTVCALTILSIIDQCRNATNGLSGLVGNKFIDLDTDISTLIDEKLWKSMDPEGFTAGDQPKITVRRLLSHTADVTVSGFGGYPRLEAIEKEIVDLSQQIESLANFSDLNLLTLKTLQEKLQKLKLEKSKAEKITIPSSTEDIILGKGNSDPIKVKHTLSSIPTYEYSGGGTTIVQHLIEVLTGQKYEDAVKERVFDKLELDKDKDSCFFPDEDHTIHGNDYEGAEIAGHWHKYPELAAAGMWSTPKGLAKIAIGIQSSLKGDKKGIISRELSSEMLMPQDGKNAALGVFLEQTSNSKYFYHRGGNKGFKCIMIANTKGQGAVIMTNSDRGESLYAEIIKSIAKTYDWDDRTKLPMLKESSLAPEEIEAIVLATPVDFKKWAEYSGTYQFGAHIIEISVLENKISFCLDSDMFCEVSPLTNTLGTIHQPGGIEVVRFQTSEDGSLNLLYANAEHKKIA